MISGKAEYLSNFLDIALDQLEESELVNKDIEMLMESESPGISKSRNILIWMDRHQSEHYQLPDIDR